MFKRAFLYDFGVSQDDSRSELEALNPSPGDRILAIASAGEVPLELLINSDRSVSIDACDISKPQIFLSNLKLQSSIQLATIEAAQFLGYLPAAPSLRNRWFQKVRENLTKTESDFWLTHPRIFKIGPIHLGRYETYMARFSPIGRLLLGGKRKLRGLFEADGISEQMEYFDTQLRSGLLKNLFKLMFHPRLYRSGGIAEQGLIHMKDESVGLTFYTKFRDFCTATPVRENWMLQFVLFNRVLFEDALPDYLHPSASERLRDEQDRLRFIYQSYTAVLETADPAYYNLFALSNLSDWLPEADFMHLMAVIGERAGKNARGLSRYIHSSGIVPSELPDSIRLDVDYGEHLLKRDRFPFYKLIPFEVTSHESHKKF